MLRFIQVQIVQTSQTAFMNATYTIEVRLAPWLLMIQYQLGGGDLPTIYEFLSLMLGAQRSSTSFAVQALEGHR